MRRLGLFCVPWLLTAVTSAAAQDSPSYAKQVRPFFVKYCIECHNAKNDKRGLILETHKSLMEGSDLGPVLIAGKPNESKLVQVLIGKDKTVMPPKTAKRFPSKKEIEQVRAWVAAGAKDDSGLVKVAIPDIKPRRRTSAPVTALAFSLDGKRLLATGKKGVDYIDPAIAARVNEWGGFEAKVTALAFSRNGTHLAVFIGAPRSPAKGWIHNYLRAGSPFPLPQVFESVHADVVLSAAFSADNRWLATCSYDTKVKLLPFKHSGQPLILNEHSDSVYGVAFSPDSNLIATAAADRTVKMWEVATGKLLYTLGESTDWLYTVAFSPDGKQVAAAGVDKSIRVWEVSAEHHKLVHSVFGHEAPVTKLIYANDGKTLYSLGEDRIVKAWDAGRMVERKVYPPQPETVLCMALSPDQKQLALGRYDGIIILVDVQTGETKEINPGQRPTRIEAEPNDTPGNAQSISLPSNVRGTLGRAGDVDCFGFQVKKGQGLGIRVIKLVQEEKKKKEKKKAESPLEPVLQLVDRKGRVLAESADGLLGHTFEAEGAYAVIVRDREFRGGDKYEYRLEMGDVPIITSVFPLGVQQGKQAEIQVKGVNLEGKTKLTVKAAKDAAPGTRLPIAVDTSLGKALGNRSVVVGEFPEVVEGSQRSPPGPASKGGENPMPVPGTANGHLQTAGQTDTWTFSAKKGEKVIIEVSARRLGSALDSFIEVLDGSSKPVPRATLRSMAKTYVAFRDHDSAQGNIRIEAWGELAANDYIYVGNELLKIRSLPTHPDADCIFFADRGQRTGFLDTTPTHQSMGMPMYKVAIHPPGTMFSPNGFPVVTLYYRNDDGGPGFGRDSRISFDPPADGVYRVRVGDTRGQGGENYTYRLTVRPPRPSFNVSFNPSSPAVYKGGAIPITVNADRIDGYEGEIKLRLDNLPAGFDAPPTAIPAGENSTAFAIYADANAMDPGKAPNLKLVASAMIGGNKVVKEVTGGAAKLIDSGEILTRTDEAAVTLKPGGTTKLTVHIERRDKFDGRVPIDVKGLPHGVKVLDIGLNGILITERETRRTMVLYAEPWVEPMDHPIVVLARREGKNTEHAAKSVLLKIAK